MGGTVIGGTVIGGTVTGPMTIGGVVIGGITIVLGMVGQREASAGIDRAHPACGMEALRPRLPLLHLDLRQMVAAGLVLLTSDRTKTRPALVQLTPPLLGVVLLAVGLAA